MKTIFTTILLLLFTISFGQNSLLWKIEGNNLKEESYLFGTVHMICKSDYEMKEKLKDVISLTNQAYFEIDMGNPNFISEMQANMMSDKLLSSMISKEDSIYLDSELKQKYGTGLAAFDQLKPMIVMSMLMQSSFPCELTSFEEEIIKMYKEQNKAMGGLSTVKEQYGYLDRFVDSKEMVKTIKSLGTEEFDSVFKTIGKLYKNEDIVGLDNVMVKYTGANPEMYEVLMVERNQIWAEKITSIIKENSTLLAVGSGHLAGEKGLISLLKAQGYTVTPIF